ncbi:hypothetical protein Ae201684P_000735 [Aphanomyces euteiches]|uniref:Reverse transcriptase Ty1/copia-type domain-containing protein n=1 Tax=Aphanomyces euteiches TaxID=100861 RepID=A0A6G0XQN3_9STRA|nr:hypothetical protein Ae201684_002367 [Aphanomyces euteiches]KAH9087324.1 hypothetical protein Ae201684P_000735 [Aphanomyces euteiches]
MLKRFQLDRARPATIQVLKASDSPTEDQTKSEAYAAMHASYRQGVGSLMYLMLGTRPDLAYAVQSLNRFLNRPGKKHFGEMKRIMRYVAGTMNYGLPYRGSELDLCGYTGSDYAANPATDDSTDRGSVDDRSYIALTQAAKDELFMKTLNCELGNPIKTGSIIRVDNQPAMVTACNPLNHSRTKHIDVRYHFVRERVQLEELKLENVPSRDNIADLFTKPLVAAVFVPLRETLGLCLPPMSPSTPTTTTNSAHPSAHYCDSACNFARTSASTRPSVFACTNAQARPSAPCAL